MEIYEKFVGGKKIAGIKTSTSNTVESNPETACIPALWQRFFTENIEEQIPNRVDEGTLFGVYTDYDNEQRGHYSLIAGREVSDIVALPEGFAAVNVPEALYLVFASEGDMPAVIYSTWQTIWEYFSSTADYARAFTTDFELYSDDNPARIEIYIAIKK
ncbi:MAG: GyrI-like domain-containing protein [Gammaproteobacteria bacterium]|nr:GyrI-like domain-containing protein [Gammaproteobacteria bacterium]